MLQLNGFPPASEPEHRWALPCSRAFFALGLRPLPAEAVPHPLPGGSPLLPPLLLPVRDFL